MPRAPKGVVTRTWPDWNYANLYWARANALQLASSDSPIWVGLTNTLSAGQSLVLWHVEITQAFRTSNLAYPSLLAAAWQYNFTSSNGGSQAGGSLSIPGAQGLATPFSGAQGGGGPTPTQANFWTDAMSPTTGAYIWPHEWPYAIIPPQYGIAWFLEYVTTPQQGNGGTYAKFIYEVVPAPT